MHTDKGETDKKQNDKEHLRERKEETQEERRRGNEKKKNKIRVESLLDLWLLRLAERAGEPRLWGAE